MSTSSLRALLKDATPDLRKIGRSMPKMMKHPKMQKTFFKLMTKIWSEDEESRRVLAFINIMKAVDISPECIPLCIKTMFVTFVRNTKFVFGGTIAQINFMRMSLLELLAKDLDEAYIHAFVYIRQLAICLRKANTSHSKEDLQAVQNWQFVNSLQLWSEFIAQHATTHKLIQSLVHPIVQLIMGLVHFSPGERWIPLRFHCVSMLHSLAGVPVLLKAEDAANAVPLTGNSLLPANRLLVPSLPILLDVFRLINFNRRATTVSAAPMDLRLLLHFSPSQRRETGALDAIVSWLFDLLAEAAAIQANSVAFPEFAHPVINELKQFARTCRVAAFTRQMKALQSKLREQSEWIQVRRRRLRNLANKDELINLESTFSRLDESSTAAPFYTFYACHKDVRAQELARLTESHKKEAIPGDSVQPKSKFQDEVGKQKSDDDSDSAESDESYDLDDGTTVTHVSRRKESKVTTAAAMDVDNEQEDRDSEDSDFDLEAELKEPEEKSESEHDADEVTDFDLSSSEEDSHPEEEEVSSVSSEDDQEADTPSPAVPSKRKAKLKTSRRAPVVKKPKLVIQKSNPKKLKGVNKKNKKPVSKRR